MNNKFNFYLKEIHNKIIFTWSPLEQGRTSLYTQSFLLFNDLKSVSILNHKKINNNWLPSWKANCKISTSFINASAFNFKFTLQFKIDGFSFLSGSAEKISIITDNHRKSFIYKTGGLQITKEQYISFLKYLLISNGGVEEEIPIKIIKKKGRLHYIVFETSDKKSKKILFTRLPKKILCDDFGWNKEFFEHTYKNCEIKAGRTPNFYLDIENNNPILRFPCIDTINNKIHKEFTIEKLNTKERMQTFFQNLSPNIKDAFLMDLHGRERGRFHSFQISNQIIINNSDVITPLKRLMEVMNYTSLRDINKRYDNVEKLIEDFNDNWEGWDDGVEIK